MKRKTRVMVVGCGSIATKRHLPEYKAQPKVEVVAVFDPNLKRAEQVAKQFGVPNAMARFRADYDWTILADAVSICSPCAFHAEQTVIALEQGLHVLCEKPMAGKYTDAVLMVEAAESSKQRLMIGLNQRLHPAHVLGKKIYKQGYGKLGRCLTFTAAFAHSGPEGWSVDGQDCHFFKRGQAVWGVLADLGVHVADRMGWLLGEDFTKAFAVKTIEEKKVCDVEDVAHAILTTDTGIVGSMNVNWVMKPGSTNATVLYCQKGTLHLFDDPEFPVIVRVKGQADEKYAKKDLGAIQNNEEGGQTSTGVIDAFVKAIRSGKDVPIPGRSALNSLATIIACAKSAQTGKMEKVKEC